MRESQGVQVKEVLSMTTAMALESRCPVSKSLFYGLRSKAYKLRNVLSKTTSWS